MSRKNTLTLDVYDRVRADLLLGRIEPGSKLLLAPLSERLGVSPSVVREALSRLAEQRLVVATPQRGFRVMSLSADDLLDLAATRIDIETLAVRRSVEHGDLAWETSLVAAHHTLARTPVSTDDTEPNDAWIEAHREFHRALLAGCGSPRLEQIAGNLRDSAELYRAWARSLAGDDTRDVGAEHRLLMEYAVARRVEETRKALAAHIQRTTDALMAHVSAQHDGRI